MRHNYDPDIHYICKECEKNFEKRAHREELVAMNLCPSCYTNKHMDRVVYGADKALAEEEEHAERHKILHKRLDELIADWVHHTGQFISTNTVYDLMQWSGKQAKQLDHKRH